MDSDFYIDFENNFRGSREQIIDVLSNYDGFIDYIFDPLIRALTLEKLLHQVKINPYIKTFMLKKYNKHQFHIAHPMIRCLFSQKVNDHYRDNKAQNILINE